MKKKFIIKYASIITVVLGAAFVMASCKKFVEIPPPINSLVTSQLFADSTDATAAINGIYINMMNRSGSLNIANSATSVFGSLSADETYYSINVASYTEFYINAITVTNTNNTTNLWAKGYTYIYQANACIEGVANNSALSATLKNRITGEAKFIRAYMYFYLVNLYGPVPLAVTTDYNVTDILPRASITDVYTQINTDLKDAQTLLGSDPIPINKVRVNRFAVNAFLARVQLYQQQWAAAEAAASSVISAAYKLESLNNVFLNGSQEQIWQMTPIAANEETTEGQLYIPSSATSVPQFVVTNNLLNAFEANDQRKVLWLNSNTVAGTKYVYPYKYKLGLDINTIPKEAYSMLRLGEQYLIRAEARAQQNNLAGAVADINAIRTRAGLPNTTATTQTAVLTAIQHERQTELFCEWAHRWLDLKRTNTIDAVLGANKTGWTSTAALYPVPYTQIQLNPFLTQNPGY